MIALVPWDRKKIEIAILRPYDEGVFGVYRGAVRDLVPYQDRITYVKLVDPR